MIEIVYNNDEGEDNNEPVKLPKNIRQVGDVSAARKIYIEDYAYNYIEEFDDGGKMCVGVLLGETRRYQNERYLFIKGAMAVENVEISGDNVLFTEETWNSVYNGMKQYFPDHEILGWYVIISDFDGDVLKKLKKSHSDNFAGNEKTLYVVDRTEYARYFGIYENNRLLRLSGYIIYYEKNESMQNFLVDTRNGHRIEDESRERVKGNFRKLLQEKELIDDNGSRSAFMTYVANAVMVVMILFIGMYMMNNQGKIEKLDLSVEEMSNEISDMFVSENEGFNANRDSSAYLGVEKESKELIPVVEINGDVYPLENQSADISAETGQAVEATSTGQNTQTSSSITETVSEQQIIRIKEGETEYVQEPASERLTERIVEQATDYSTERAAEAQTEKAPEIMSEKATSSEPVNVNSRQYETYEIKKGETLITISKKFYGDTSMIDSIMALNDIDNRDYIYEGQIIKLP